MDLNIAEKSLYLFNLELMLIIFGHIGGSKPDSKRGCIPSNSKDFNPKYFTSGWDTVYGDRCCIYFPVEMKCAKQNGPRSYTVKRRWNKKR